MEIDALSSSTEHTSYKKIVLDDEPAVIGTFFDTAFTDPIRPNGDDDKRQSTHSSCKRESDELSIESSVDLNGYLKTDDSKSNDVSPTPKPRCRSAFRYRSSSPATNKSIPCSSDADGQSTTFGRDSNLDWEETRSVVVHSDNDDKSGRLSEDASLKEDGDDDGDELSIDRSLQEFFQSIQPKTLPKTPTSAKSNNRKDVPEQTSIDCVKEKLRDFACDERDPLSWDYTGDLGSTSLANQSFGRPELDNTMPPICSDSRFRSSNNSFSTNAAATLLSLPRLLSGHVKNSPRLQAATLSDRSFLFTSPADLNHYQQRRHQDAHDTLNLLSDRGGGQSPTNLDMLDLDLESDVEEEPIERKQTQQSADRSSQSQSSRSLLSLRVDIDEFQPEATTADQCLFNRYTELGREEESQDESSSLAITPSQNEPCHTTSQSINKLERHANRVLKATSSAENKVRRQLDRLARLLQATPPGSSSSITTGRVSSSPAPSNKATVDNDGPSTSTIDDNLCVKVKIISSCYHRPRSAARDATQPTNDTYRIGDGELKLKTRSEPTDSSRKYESVTSEQLTTDEVHSSERIQSTSPQFTTEEPTTMVSPLTNVTSMQTYTKMTSFGDRPGYSGQVNLVEKKQQVSPALDDFTPESGQTLVQANSKVGDKTTNPSYNCSVSEPSSNFTSLQSQPLFSKNHLQRPASHPVQNNVCKAPLVESSAQFSSSYNQLFNTQPSAKIVTSTLTAAKQNELPMRYTSVRKFNNQPSTGDSRLPTYTPSTLINSKSIQSVLYSLPLAPIQQLDNDDLLLPPVIDSQTSPFHEESNANNDIIDSTPRIQQTTSSNPSPQSVTSLKPRVSSDIDDGRATTPLTKSTSYTDGPTITSERSPEPLHSRPPPAGTSRHSRPRRSAMEVPIAGDRTSPDHTGRHLVNTLPYSSSLDQYSETRSTPIDQTLHKLRHYHDRRRRPSSDKLTLINELECALLKERYKMAKAKRDYYARRGVVRTIQDLLARSNSSATNVHHNRQHGVPEKHRRNRHRTFQSQTPTSMSSKNNTPTLCFTSPSSRTKTNVGSATPQGKNRSPIKQQRGCDELDSRDMRPPQSGHDHWANNRLRIGQLRAAAESWLTQLAGSELIEVKRAPTSMSNKTYKLDQHRQVDDDQSPASSTLPRRDDSPPIAPIVEPKRAHGGVTWFQPVDLHRPDPNSRIHADVTNLSKSNHQPMASSSAVDVNHQLYPLSQSCKNLHPSGDRCLNSSIDLQTSFKQRMSHWIVQSRERLNRLRYRPRRCTDDEVISSCQSLQFNGGGILRQSSFVYSTSSLNMPHLTRLSQSRLVNAAQPRLADSCDNANLSNSCQLGLNQRHQKPKRKPKLPR